MKRKMKGKRTAAFYICLCALAFLLYSCASSASTSKSVSGETEAPEPSTQTAPADTDSSEVAKSSSSVSETTLSEAEEAEPMPEAADTATEMEAPLPSKAKKSAEGQAAADDLPGEKEAAQEENRQQASSDHPEPIYLSADDSNSAASPVIARKLILSGKYVHPALVRTYEFLNYYSFDYKEPENSPIRIIPRLKKMENNTYSLQVALRSKNRSFNDASPFQFTILLDTSGSMAGEPAELLRRFIFALNEKLRPQDRMSLVTFNRDAEVAINNCPAGVKCKKQLEDAFSKLETSDITHLESGILLAYTLAEETYSAERLNRVLVLSDGGANAGTTSEEIIGQYAEDSDKQGIYLAGISMGEGFNDSMMNTLTDKGRGAYLFLDSTEEIENILGPGSFLSNFDLAVKDVRLKMEMPSGWSVEQFHGEQMSTTASDVTPQYLAPGDQMIYNMELQCAKEEIASDVFTFEAQFAPIGGRLTSESITVTVDDMSIKDRSIIKGDAIVAYAEMLKKIQLPLEQNVDANLTALDRCVETVEEAVVLTGDEELTDIVSMLEIYRMILQFGEQLGNTPDKHSDTPDAALGISPNTLEDMEIRSDVPEKAIQVLSRLLNSTRLVPQEGYKFLALSSGPVGNPWPSGSGDLTGKTHPDPQPQFMGFSRAISGTKQRVYDLSQIEFTFTAPANAKSFSFDFNFFSAEYPDYIQQNFNDTFYAIIRAKSTNNGAPTNISFDANNNSIEVDNNYFQNPFHPIPNTGTGFDAHGSTGWLRTSWPIQGGETFRLTFSVHDEGDGIYDSLVVLDNFAFHSHNAVGTTDPLN